MSKSTKKKPPPSVLARARTSIRERLGRQADDVWGVVLLVISAVIVLSFFGQAGPVGRGIDTGLRFAFGFWAYVVPLGLVAIGAALIIGKPRSDYAKLATGIVTTFLGTLALFHLMTGTEPLYENIERVRETGGALGSLISFPLRRLIGLWGAFVVLAAVTSMGLLILTKTTVRQLFQAIGQMMKAAAAWARSLRGRKPPRTPHRKAAPVVETPTKQAAKSDKPKSKRPKTRDTRAEEPPPPVQEPEVIPTTTHDTAYEKPSLDLLEHGGGETDNRRMLEETARELEDTLLQHGVDARLTKIVPGPTVTRYEIELAPGVKVNRVTTLAHDIAYALATPDVRLLAPIPGKSAIGVEVPNRRRRIVTLGDVLRSEEAQKASHPLTVGLGMDINGRARMLNLAELPHVLIAGATGAGKSSCINSIVTSLLIRTHPDDVRLIMVDPKRVELGQYNGVPHLLTRVITNPKKAADALKWAVDEMDRRYDQLADAGVRDIVGYRAKLEAGELDPESFDRFPYLVVLIDELNDLMMVAGREVEASIVRIAQMARAVGIHLVIATQRPSVNVITGVIKANVPSRLAFSVASQTDSRVIIDGQGAEKLIGMGDMLVVTAKEPKPARIQGAWVSEGEIHDVVDWVKAQREARYQDKVIEASAAKAAAAAAEDDDEDAALLRQAMELIVRSQLGSTSMLQRKLRIGFARAGRVMDILEQRGVVGPSQGSKARDVLMTEDELDEALAASSS